MKITNYSSEQEKISYEIASNPELQKSELAPKAKKVCWHEQIYKTLATVGDFSCFVLYFDENYDPTRTSQGTRRIHIVGSETRIEDELELNENKRFIKYIDPALINSVVSRFGQIMSG